MKKHRNGIFWCSLLLLLTLAFLPACKTDPGESNLTNHVGTYALVAINGAPLPTRPPHGPRPPEVQAGSITLNADSTLTCAMTLVSGGKTNSNNTYATYTRKGSRFVMKWNNGGRTTATLKDATFTMNNEGILLTFRK